MEQDQNSKSFVGVILNRRGQAAVEYILLAVIVVSLMIGMKNVFSTINDGINRYIGDYIVCLMEYGELPTLGVQDTGLKKHVDGSGKTCDKNFAAFSFDEGRKYTGGGGSNRSGSGAGSGGSNSANSGRDRNAAGDKAGNQNSSNTADNNDREGDEGDDATGAGGLGRGGRSGSKKPAAKGGIGTSPSIYGTADNGFDDAQKVRVLDEDPEGEAKKKRDRNRSSRLSNRIIQPNPYRAISGRMAQEIEKQRPNRLIRRPTSTAKPFPASEDSRIGPYKKTFTPPVAVKTAEMADNNSGFGFGNILRWLLIAAMVIAIVIFFGGQVMNYSNSND